MTLTKDNIVDRLSTRGYTKKDASIAINDLIRVVMDALIDGDSVQFHGFGTFEVRNIASRETTDMQTKRRITIPPFKSPKFTAGKLLKRAVKEGFIRE